MYALRRLPRSCTRFIQIRGNATEATPAVEAATPPPPPLPAVAEQKPEAVSPSSASQATDAKGSEKQEKKVNDVKNAIDARKPRRQLYPTSRPSITLDRPRQYMRPIGVGVLPAYDEALKYIKKDSAKLKRQLSGVQAELGKVQTSEDPQEAEQVQKLQEKVHILEVQSEINLPSVRWKARNGLGTCPCRSFVSLTNLINP
jgi:large subunit ribosomal protein L35